MPRMIFKAVTRTRTTGIRSRATDGSFGFSFFFFILKLRSYCGTRTLNERVQLLQLHDEGTILQSSFSADRYGTYM